MTVYHTGNPLGSAAAKDLFDNAQNFDFAINDITNAIWQDRFGRNRQTWYGLEQLAKAAIAAFGYITLDSFQAGATLTLPNQVLRDTSTGEYYRWDGAFPKTVPAGSTPASSGGVSLGAWLGVGDAVLRSQISNPAGATLYPELQLARWRDTGDVRGWGAISGGVTLCDSFFQAAEAANKPLYVPVGMWRISTPMALGQKAQYYGPGVLVFDNAEWWRRGGSSGSESVAERYTLLYDYPNKDAVTLTYDGVNTPFTWVDDRTILAAGTALTVNVKINIAKGYLRLGSSAEMTRSYNLFGNSGGGSKVDPQLTDPITQPTGYNSTAYGARSMIDLESGVNNSAFGSRSLMTNKVGNNNTVSGFQAGYRLNADGNTIMGSIAGEWLMNGRYNSLFGTVAGGKLTDGSFNCFYGASAGGEGGSDQYVVAMGYRAHGNAGDYSLSNSIYIGSFCGDFNIGSNNTFVGYRAGQCTGAATAPGAGTGHDNTGIGMYAMAANLAGKQSVVVGAGAATAASLVERSVVIGFEACTASISLGLFTVAIGHSALKSVTGDNNLGVGTNSQLATKTGTGNVSVGNGSLITNETGSNNTALGFNAGRLTLSGGSTINFNNTMALGADARVSGDNQNQVGNSASTTYVYGTVQNRSDLRDKSDIRNTELGIEFILGLRAVDGRWDLRDDYVEVIEKTRTVQVPVEKEVDGELLTVMEDREETYIEQTIQHTPDGTHKRQRFHHWFIAQEVQSLCESLGVEFGGLQHHSVNGGEDVYSLGYDEFIPPVVNAVQACWARMDELEARLVKLESQ